MNIKFSLDLFAIFNEVLVQFYFKTLIILIWKSWKTGTNNTQLS